MITRRKIPLILGIVFLFFLSVSLSLFSEGETKEKKDRKTQMYKKLDLLAEALSFIEDKYVEEQEPKDLIYGAINGLILSLDPYSQFLKPDAYKELLVETQGKFGGLGIEITIRKGLLTIISPIEDTPAWRAGLKPGDIIIKIEGESTEGITLNEAVKKLRGKPGTKVTITILREKEREAKEITITRDIIKIKDIKRAIILEDNIAYVKLTEFRESTPKDFKKALADLKKQGMKGLILDLRNNPGGLLNSAIEIASLFLPTGKKIVSTRSREGKEVEYNSLPMVGKYLKMPIVVLINKGSASASEIVAAALRENNRAVLLGRESFGKASVQTVIPLSDGSALRLTTAKYYTPQGNSIHEKGVHPDIVILEDKKKKNEEEKAEDIFRRLEREKKQFDYRDDYPIVRALDLIRSLLILAPSYSNNIKRHIFSIARVDYVYGISRHYER